MPAAFCVLDLDLKSGFSAETLSRRLPPRSNKHQTLPNTSSRQRHLNVRSAHSHLTTVRGFCFEGSSGSTRDAARWDDLHAGTQLPPHLMQRFNRHTQCAFATVFPACSATLRTSSSDVGATPHTVPARSYRKRQSIRSTLRRVICLRYALAVKSESSSHSRRLSGSDISQ